MTVRFFFFLNKVFYQAKKKKKKKSIFIVCLFPIISILDYDLNEKNISDYIYILANTIKENKFFFSVSNYN
jgi:hypothetical protein